jgi:hypothetical protein
VGPSALYINDIDWSRSRLHLQRTWSEDGGRIEATEDGEDRWVKLPASNLEALRAQVEAMALEAQLHRWTHEQRRLVFPNSQGKVTRYGAFSEHVWQPLRADERHLRASRVGAARGTRESRRGVDASAASLRVHIRSTPTSGAPSELATLE